jgi:hypothetical protein
MTTYSSSGNSNVTLSASSATQQFQSKGEYERCVEIARTIQKSPSISFTIQDVNAPVWEYTYRLSDFHSRMESHDVGKQSITWHRIFCLNQIQDVGVRIGLIRENRNRFLWDIFRAIFGLHEHGIAHGDVSLDNIGIRQGKFVLYDYNLSQQATEERKNRDVHSLFRSLRFHLGDLYYSLFPVEMEFVRHLTEFLEIVQHDRRLSTLRDTMTYLDALLVFSP